MSDSRRLLLAALVLVIGLVAAFAFPPGMCQQGELVEDPAEPGTYRCKIMYDVFLAARSLMVLKYVTASVTVLVAIAIAAPVLVRRLDSATVQGEPGSAGD